MWWRRNEAFTKGKAKEAAGRCRPKSSKANSKSSIKRIAARNRRSSRIHPSSSRISGATIATIGENTEHPPVYTVPTQAKYEFVYRRIPLKVAEKCWPVSRVMASNPRFSEGLAEEIADVVAMDVEVAVVIGGGNIFRRPLPAPAAAGAASADYMGMLATVLKSRLRFKTHWKVEA